MNEWQERLRVAMFTNVYLPSNNGVVVSVEAFRKALTRLGHDIFVFGPNSGEIKERPPFVFRYPALELPLQSYPLTVPMSPYIDRVLRNLQPQLLHAQHPALLGRVAEHKSEELNLPLVFTYHTRYSDYSHYAWPIPAEQVRDFLFHWMASFLSQCHHLVVPSESLKRLLQESYGIETHLSVVPTGIDLEKFSPCSRAEARRQLGWSEQDTMLVSVGRLAQEKSFDMLIQAFARLAGGERVQRLVIVGSGDERANLEQLCARLGVADRVCFTGLVAHSQIPIYLKAADLFVFASLTETQGLVTLEALASGLPVVAVDASGTRDTVTPDCSLLTESNAQALAEGIGAMLARGDLGREREAARQRAAQFGFMAQGQAMVEVYREAIETHRQGLRVRMATDAWRDRWQEFLNVFRL